MPDARFELDPRLAGDTLPVKMLHLCQVRLMDDARWPWLILVPQLPGLREVIDLGATDAELLNDDIRQAATALRDLLAPYKLNIAALGNVVEQLHVHVIGRNPGDPAWPAPVWGSGERVPYAPEAARKLCAQLAERLVFTYRPPRRIWRGVE